MFSGRYSEIFGRGERPGCILNLGHTFDAIERIFEIASVSITLAPSFARPAASMPKNALEVWTVFLTRPQGQARV